MGDEPADAGVTATGPDDDRPALHAGSAGTRPGLGPDMRAAVSDHPGGAGSDVLPDQESTRTAFSAFYQMHQPRLVRFLILDGAPARLAADIAQDAMTDLYRKWDTVRSPWAWVRTAASRAWIRYRTQIPELPVDDAALPLLISDSAAAEIEARHELLRLLGQLSPRERQVMARLFDGDTYAEIAIELQIGEATVRSTARNARTKLVARNQPPLPGYKDGTER